MTFIILENWTPIIITAAICIAGFIVAEIAEYNFYDLLALISASISLLSLILLMTFIFITPHSNKCDCNDCYEIVGTYNGINTYLHNDNMYYYNEKTKEYTAIIESDGTNLTYEEYIEYTIN